MAHYTMLKKNYEFSRVYRKGRRLTAATLTLHAFKRRDSGENRLGFAVVRSNGGSVRRNRLKRLLRESYRSLQEECHSGFDLVFTAKAPATLPGYARIRKDLRAVLRQAQVLAPTLPSSEMSIRETVSSPISDPASLHPQSQMVGEGET